MRRSFITCLLTAVLGVHAPAWAGFTIMPGSPRANEAVYARVTAAGCDAFKRGATTTMSSNRITITMPVTSGAICFQPSPPPETVDVSIGQFPAGNYVVEVLTQSDTATSSMGTQGFTVQPRQVVDPLANYTDLWWNPNQSGWGLNIVQHPGNMLFATWFEYDDDGRPAWYTVSSGQWSAPGSNDPNSFFNGPIYRTSGPTGGIVDPSRVTRTLVGTASFAFIAWDRLEATLTINGRARQLSLQRQPF